MIGIDAGEIVIAAIPPGVVFRVGGVPALFIRRGDQVIFPGVPDSQPQPAEPTGPADTPPPLAQDPAAVGR